MEFEIYALRGFSEVWPTATVTRLSHVQERRLDYSGCRFPTKRTSTGRVQPVDTAARRSLIEKQSGVHESTPLQITRGPGRALRCRITSCLRLALCLLFAFGSQFSSNGFLDLLGVHPVVFGSVHKNVIAAGGGSLISRIQQADFEKQLAEFGLVVGAHLLGQKLLCGRGVLLYLHLVPLRQSRYLAVGEMANQAVGDRQQVGLLQRSRYALEDRGQDAMTSRNGQFLLFDPLPFFYSLPLDLLRRRRVGVVDAASWIGTNLDDLSALAAVHHDGLSHLLAWLLVSG